MFNRYIEAREMRQFRKAQEASQKRRMLFILLAVMGAVLVAISVGKAVMPAEPVKAAVSIPTATQQERQDIQEFAVVVTKPLDTLTPEDFQLITSKENDPCYNASVGVKLNQAQIVQTIIACKALK